LKKQLFIYAHTSFNLAKENIDVAFMPYLVFTIGARKKVSQRAI
jgi:hypothetical protein